MKKTISIKSSDNLLQLYEDNSSISANLIKDDVHIKLNKEGCIELAKHLLYLSETYVGYHFHLDSSNSLEDNSLNLIIELT